MTDVKELMLVAGARPNFMKIAPVIREIEARDHEFSYTLVHTGQHYDEGMSEVFFRGLGIPKPNHHLNVGSGSHAVQTAKIMVEFEPVLKSANPDCVMVFGDVNSTLACSVVAKKLGYPVAHVEAGLRSGDLQMPEEINRIVTDSISDYFFVTEVSGLEHLRREGKPDQVVFHVGHVMIDNLFFEVQKLDVSTPKSDIVSQFIGSDTSFGVVTMHRPSNVDDEEVLSRIFSALKEIAAELPLVFPIHPRTRDRMEAFGLPTPSGVHLCDPLGYQEFLNLWRRAAVVLTDSGGLQEETTGLGIPCITMRDSTERPVTISEGTNRLVGNDPAKITAAVREILERPKAGRRPKFWDGRASGRILDCLKVELSS